MKVITRLAVAAVSATLLLAMAARAEDKTGFLGVGFDRNPAGKGLTVTEVTKGSPAEKAGLKAKDVITKIDGKDANDVDAFRTTVKTHKPGDKVTLTVMRDGKEMEIKATLGEAPATPTPPPPEKKQASPTA